MRLARLHAFRGLAAIGNLGAKARRLCSPRALLAAAALGALPLAIGCETRSWFDPSEVAGARRNFREPLVVEILDQIDPALEEPDRVFTQAEGPRQEDLVTTVADYTVSPNDLLVISITDLQGPGVETVVQKRVTATGNITLPYIGQLPAEGRSELELEQAIVDAYKTEGLIERAQVSVAVVEARGRAFQIMGAVNRPGQFAIIENDFRVLDALVLAGDVQSPLLEDMYIIRKPKPERAAPATAPTGDGPVGPAEEDLAPRDPGTPPEDGGATPGTEDETPGTTGAEEAGPGARATPHGAKARGAKVRGVSARSNRSSRPLMLNVAADDAEIPPEDAGIEAEVEVDADPVARPTTRPTADDDAEVPDVAPAEVPPVDEEEPGARITTIEGRDVVVQPEDAGNGADAGTTPGMGTSEGTMDAGPMRRGGAGSFEFNELQAPDNIRVIRIPIQEVRNGNFKYNIAIKPGDTIIVPTVTIGEYYMGGHIARPGAYSLTGRKITLKQAIIAASMLDALAIPQRTEIIRRLPNPGMGPDREVFVRVDVDKIFAGEQPDIYLKPDDQVIVGTNALAPFLAAVRGAFRITYGFGFLYDRNYAVDQDQQR